MIRASANTAGKLWTRQRVAIQPEVNSSQTMYIPLGAPRSAVGITGLMYATVLFGLSGKITYQPAYRTYEADPTVPDSWSDLGSAQTNVTADEAVNFGSMSLTSTKMWIQPGLKISSSDNDCRGTFDVVVAGKWG